MRTRLTAAARSAEDGADRAAAAALHGHAGPPGRTPGPTPSAGPATPVAGLGPGRPLDADARAHFEPRFGHDFSGVRIHDDRAAAASAGVLHARAYTVGRNIVFGEGEFAPGTETGRRVLAHELAHTVQPDHGGGIARLEATMCATDCDTPEGSTAPTGRFEITAFADKEGPFLGIPLTSKVGHAWVRLTDDTGTYWSYGFWPQQGFDASDLKADDEGCVHSPDGERGDPAHHPTASRTFPVTAAQFAAARSTARSICAARPKYNLFGLQCTEFVRLVLDAAGQVGVGGFGLIFESPNALASWIRTQSLTVGVGVAANEGGGRGDVGASLQVNYLHQFYSLLGNHLRLEWGARGELGSRLSAVSTGVGVEATTGRVFLPSAYVFGGGFAGGLALPGQDGQQAAAGVTAGAGLRFSIDEIATVGVEYDLVKDLVRGDPQLERLMITAGIRLW